MEHPGYGTQMRKGGNDPGFALLNRSHEATSCWSFPPFRYEVRYAACNAGCISAVTQLKENNDGAIQDRS
jgi:hypothetical protein